jgi:hypothetical protein
MSYIENTRSLLAKTERLIEQNEKLLEEHPEYRTGMEDNIWSLKKLRDQLRADLSTAGVLPSPLDAAWPAPVS